MSLKIPNLLIIFYFSPQLSPPCIMRDNIQPLLLFRIVESTQKSYNGYCSSSTASSCLHIGRWDRSENKSATKRFIEKEWKKKFMTTFRYVKFFIFIYPEMKEWMENYWFLNVKTETIYFIAVFLTVMEWKLNFIVLKSLIAIKCQVK